MTMIGMKKCFWLCAIAAVNVVIAGRAFGVVRYAENYGDDLNPCSFSSPCRSITQAVLAASEGDVILVGPGGYGDLNRDGVDDAGEDANGIVIAARLTVVARRGPATTVIEGPTTGQAVRISAKGVVLKGFTIVARNIATDNLVVIDANSAAISRPVVVVGNYLAGAGGVAPTEIHVAQSLDPAGTYAVLQANQIDGMDVGVSIDNSKRATVAANTITASGTSIILDNGRSLVNPSCGLVNNGTSTIIATNNFWGSASGPGTVPANLACNTGGGSVTTAPFSTV